MTLFFPNSRSMAIILALAWVHLPSPGFGQEQKEAPSRLPDGLRMVLARRDDKFHGYSGFAFSPDGERVAVTQHGGTDIWDLRIGKKHPATIPVDRIDRMMFTPDGKALVTLNGEQGLMSWEVETGKRLRSYWTGREVEHPRHFNGPAFSPSLEVMACVVDGTVRFWKLADGRELTERRIAPPKGFRFTGVAYSPDGSLLFGGTITSTKTKQQPAPDARLHCWASDSQRPVLTLTRQWDEYPDSGIGHCQLSADGRLLACDVNRRMPRKGGPPPTDPNPFELETRHFTRVWDLASGEVLFETESTSWAALSTDGRLLALAEPRNDFKVTIWDLYSQQVVTRYAYPLSRPNKGAFTPGGELFVASHSGGDFSCLCVWEVPKKLPVALPFLPRGRYWDDLGSSDPKAARQAIWNLMATPKETVALLREHLKPIPALDRDKVKDLIADLNSERFAARDKAMKQLEELSWHAAPQLEAALGNPASAAQKKLLEDLLKRLDPPYTSADRLRRLRANEVLERIGTPDAVKVLEEIAKGAPKAPETEDANASLKRLAKKAKTTTTP